LVWSQAESFRQSTAFAKLVIDGYDLACDTQGLANDVVLKIVENGTTNTNED
jgi:hypothetical protein